jgi:hypothetical protein
MSPRLVVFAVQESAPLGHGHDGLVYAEAALLKKRCKLAIFFTRIDAGKPAFQVAEMHGSEMDRVMIIFRHDRADHMAAAELAKHGIADDFAAASQSED